MWCETVTTGHGGHLAARRCSTRPPSPPSSGARPCRTCRPSATCTARRARAEQAIADVVAAPVRYVPAALLEALQGSWGEPEEPDAPPHLTHRALSLSDPPGRMCRGGGERVRGTGCERAVYAAGCAGGTTSSCCGTGWSSPTGRRRRAPSRAAAGGPSPAAGATGTTCAGRRTGDVRADVPLAARCATTAASPAASAARTAAGYCRTHARRRAAARRPAAGGPSAQRRPARARSATATGRSPCRRSERHLVPPGRTTRVRAPPRHGASCSAVRCAPTRSCTTGTATGSTTGPRTSSCGRPRSRRASGCADKLALRLRAARALRPRGRERPGPRPRPGHRADEQSPPSDRTTGSHVTCVAPKGFEPSLPP